MTNHLPPNLLALFQPRPPLRYLPAHDHAPEERKTHRIDGVADFLPALAEKKITSANDPVSESWLERQDRTQREKAERQEWLTTVGAKELFNPTKDKNVRGDAFKTLFVGRLSYNVVSKDLEQEFGRYGPIERVRIVMETNENGEIVKNSKPRGYAFVLFERESDMKAAYKECERLTIKGRPVVVDVERGRTVSDWKPRRFGGGLGGRHYTKAGLKAPSGGGFGGPPMGPGGFGGRGGFRGGFNDRGGGFRGGRGGGGGFRGGFDRSGGGRGGMGYHNGAPPDGAPAGPRGGYGGGYGGRDSYGGGGRGGRDNANFEPLPPRGGGGYRDRDRDGGGGGGRDSYNPGQKRPYDGGGYDDSRQRRRY